MKGFLGICGSMGLTVIFTLLLCSGVNYIICSDYEKETGRKTKATFFLGCYIKYGDDWYTRGEYKFITLKDIKASK